MKAKVIKTDSEYTAALARIDKLMDARPKTAQGDELELLSLLVHEYEDRVFPIDKPDPVAAIRFRMEQKGLKPVDRCHCWEVAAEFQKFCRAAAI